MHENLCKNRINSFKAIQTPVASPRARRSAPGLTVIEVLVALVILALGIFAILKIFPVGFGTIDVNRQRAIAAALANAEAERWKQLADSLYYLPSAGLADNAYSLPEAILATQYDGTVRVDYDSWDVTPAQGDLFSISPARDALLLAPATQPLWEPDSLWAPRTILGEKTVISDAAEPFHILSVAPLDYLYNPNPGVVPPQTIQVYDPEPFKIPEVGSPGEWQYIVDYNGASPGTFTFDASYNGAPFSISYSWLGTDNIVRSVVAEPGTVNSGTIQVAARGNPLFSQLVEGSEKVYFCYIDDYPSLSPTGIGHFICFPAVGVILFHPDDARNLVGINYRVYDWAILRQDITVPSTGIANLPLGYLKRAGFSNPPRDPGFDTLPSLVGVSVVALNLDNPLHDTNGSLINGSDTGDRSMKVNFRTGEINFGVDRAGSTYRVYYRARGDWAVQIQKAAAEYLPTSSAPDGQHFYWDQNVPSQLYFARSEAGKVVNISYTASDGTYVTGIVKTIPIASQPLGNSSSYVCPITLASPAPAANLVANGVSLIAKTVWAMPGKSMVPKERTSEWQQKLEDNPSLTPDDLRVEGVVRYAFLNELWNQRSITTSLPTPLR